MQKNLTFDHFKAKVCLKLCFKAFPINNNFDYEYTNSEIILMYSF